MEIKRAKERKREKRGEHALEIPTDENGEQSNILRSFRVTLRCNLPYAECRSETIAINKPAASVPLMIHNDTVNRSTAVYGRPVLASLDTVAFRFALRGNASLIADALFAGLSSSKVAILMTGGACATFGLRASRS